MNDSEMTKLCAEAMGHRLDADGGFSRMQQGAGMEEPDWFEFIYDPLHDDAQAMAMVKKFDMVIEREKEKTFGVTVFTGTYKNGKPTFVVRHQPDLNRAIVECVAKTMCAARPAI